MAVVLAVYNVIQVLTDVKTYRFVLARPVILLHPHLLALPVPRTVRVILITRATAGLPVRPEYAQAVVRRLRHREEG